MLLPCACVQSTPTSSEWAQSWENRHNNSSENTSMISMAKHQRSGGGWFVALSCITLHVASKHHAHPSSGNYIHPVVSHSPSTSPVRIKESTNEGTNIRHLPGLIHPNRSCTFWNIVACHTTPWQIKTYQKTSWKSKTLCNFSEWFISPLMLLLLPRYLRTFQCWNQVDDIPPKHRRYRSYHHLTDSVCHVSFFLILIVFFFNDLYLFF